MQMKKEKVLSPEKLAKQQATIEKQKAKDAKELAKWQAQKARPKANGYILYMFAICAVINVADEICTTLNSQLKSILATEFFAPVFGAEYAIARMDLILMVTYLFYGLAFLYKVLADRYGRKPFLVINTLGMGVAMVLISIATGIPAFVIGTCFITFFTPHDMQMSYIMESAPAQHRAKYCSIVKTISTIVTLLVPLMRNLLISSDDYSKWRLMYVIPSVIAFAAAIIALLSMRETDAFIDLRIRQLTMTQEEKEAEKLNRKQDTTSRGGILKSLKFIFTHKQLLWLALGYGLLTFCNTMATNYEAIFTANYSQTFLAIGQTVEQAKASAIDLVSAALIMVPITNALVYFAQGFVSDKIGRKPSAILFAILTLVSATIGYMGASYGLNPYVAGLLIGITAGSYWSANDNVYFIINESSPTNLRTSISGIFPIISGQFSLIAVGLSTALNNILGDTKIGTVALLMGLPGLIVFLIVFALKVKETKGIDFSTIKGDEFE